MHDFWLFREGERRYEDVADLWSRSAEARVRMDDIWLQYLRDTLAWVPTLISPPQLRRSQGLNWYAETVINHTGATVFAGVCAAWAQLFACGPALFTLRGDFSWGAITEEDQPLDWDRLAEVGEYQSVEVDRDRMVQVLRDLADYGRQTATGEYFIVHIGV